MIIESILSEATRVILNMGLRGIFYGILAILSVVTIKWAPNSEWVSDFAPNLDQSTLIFGTGVFLLAILGIELSSGSAAIALVSALTAFVAIYRLRRPDDTERPAVRQSFESIEDEEYMDFGLRNYGPGPALYLQIEATLANSGTTLFKFESREYPLHLPEGDFLGFIHDDRWPCDKLLDAITGTNNDEIARDEMVYLYYSYVSTADVREPEVWNNEPERPDDTILESLKRKSEQPRQMEVSRIWNQCSRRTKGKPRVGRSK